MPAPPRHGSIDGLRGIAVMGILLMNVANFALPAGAYFNPRGGGGTAPADIAAWAASFVLVDGKMRALFSILFGASTVLVVRSAEAAGLSPMRLHLARMATLALFGAAHFYLLWEGDILLLYAMIGALLLPFVGLEPRELIKLAILLLLAQIVVEGAIVSSFWSLRDAAALPDAPQATRAAWAALAEGIGAGSPQAIAAEAARLRGPWTGFVAHGLSLGVSGPTFQLIFDGPETLAYMLIGMAALDSGFLTGGWTPRRYRRAAAIGFAIGLLPAIALAWASAHSGFDTILTFAASTVVGVPLRPVLGLAEAALALAWLTAGDGPLRRRLRAAGRAAFTNYLGTSLVMTFLFYGWGLALFDRIERIRLYPIVLAMWVAMLLWSPAWLARYRYGPLEWAWRSLARGRMQAMKISAMRQSDIETA